jgi:cytoskeletal protein CcmA (bactofilin family)
MDPSQVQEDKSNDVHSLESAGSDDKSTDKSGGENAATTESDDGKTKVVDTTGGSGGDDNKPKKESAIKRIWHRFNIYLMLFVLVVILAVGIVAIMTIKSKESAQDTIKGQGLSTDALKQLANSDVTVGDARQVLTVQSNAIFAGSVLIKSNMEVAGTLKVGAELSIPSLRVSGATQLSDTTVTNLTVSGTVNLQGALTLKNGINVSGNSNFSGNVTAGSVTTGALNLNGDLRLTHHITAGGTIPSATRGTAVGGGGTFNISGSDTSGSISIATGSSPPAGCFVSVTFSEKFTSTPHVVVTPIGSAAADLTYYVDRTTTGFSICTTNSAPAGQSFGFDYVVLA